MTRDETLANLPQISIERLPDRSAGSPGIARCDRPPHGFEGGAVDLIVGNRVTSLDTKTPLSAELTFEFEFEPWVNDPSISVGGTYPASPWMMRNETRIAIERDVDWVRTRFDPIDAYRWKDSHHVWASMDGKNREFPPDDALGPYDPTKHTIIPLGWDHEHCAICIGRIDAQHGSWGYLSSRDEWLCESCHAAHIVNGSLDFLAEYTKSAGP